MILEHLTNQRRLADLAGPRDDLDEPPGLAEAPGENIELWPGVSLWPLTQHVEYFYSKC